VSGLKGIDEVLRLSSYAPYEFGGLKMRDYESMVKVFLLRRRMDGQLSSECNQNTDQSISSHPGFYQERLTWWKSKEKLLTLTVVVNTLFGIVKFD